ncbi:MAG: HlyC/CorC family transporter [Salinarimonadaceae bacterium]|nr:MAG: HlyC/CorC family transporter [Salinarimonadaceae bacterium]
MNEGRSQTAGRPADSAPEANDAEGSSRSAPGGLGEVGREPWFERLLGRMRLRSRDTIRTDLEDALASSAESEGFSPQERAMLRNVLGFHRTRVQDAMVPRADIVAISADTTLGDLLRIFRTAGHSRLPVYGETLDDPKGMIHIRDFLDYLVGKAETTNGRRRRVKTPDALNLGNIDLTATLANARILRPVLFVPPSMPAVELLVRMQTTRTHMALVIDEYGGTDGLVSIEDLVEMIVGDIEDEHDLATAAMIEKVEPHTFLADARADLEEVSEALGVDLTSGDLAEDIDTLGGLIVTLAGRVPARSELIAGPAGLEFEVLDADPRRLKRVRIHRRDPRAKIGPRLVTPKTGGDKQPASETAPESAGRAPGNAAMPIAENVDHPPQAAAQEPGEAGTGAASR